MKEVAKTTSAKNEKLQIVEGENTQLTTAELTFLGFLVGSKWEKMSEQERTQWKEMNIQPSPAVIASLLNRKDALIEKTADGVYKATKFGERWILGSRSIGYNFPKIFAKLNLTALHSAFFAMAEELSKRHCSGDSPALIYYYDKQKNPSAFWEKFDEAVGKIDQCLQSNPETQEEVETTEVAE